MYNVTRAVHLAEPRDDDARRRSEALLRSAAAATGAERRLVAPPLAGSINAGDLLVHLQFRDRETWLRSRPEFDAALDPSAVEKVYGVEYEPGKTGRSPGEGRNSAYRALLLRVQPDADPDMLGRFERDVLSMPHHISSIRAWRLSRVADCTGPVAWTHVWEQEFATSADVTGQYLDHPVHWAVVDRWFDPECTEVVVRDRVCHAFCDMDGALVVPE